MNIIEHSIKNESTIKCILTEESYIQDTKEVKEVKVFGLFNFKYEKEYTVNTDIMNGFKSQKQVGFKK